MFLRDCVQGGVHLESCSASHTATEEEKFSGAKNFSTAEAEELLQAVRMVCFDSHTLGVVYKDCRSGSGCLKYSFNPTVSFWAVVGRTRKKIEQTRKLHAGGSRVGIQNEDLLVIKFNDY